MLNLAMQEDKLKIQLMNKFVQDRLVMLKLSNSTMMNN